MGLSCLLPPVLCGRDERSAADPIKHFDGEDVIRIFDNDLLQLLECACIITKSVAYKRAKHKRFDPVALDEIVIEQKKIRQRSSKVIDFGLLRHLLSGKLGEMREYIMSGPLVVQLAKRLC